MAESDFASNPISEDLSSKLGEPEAKKRRLDDAEDGRKEHVHTSDECGTCNLSKEETECEKSEASEQNVFIKEHDVGITEYISKHEGFHAIVKQRYSDFIVNEIDINGHVVHLTDISCAQKEKAEVKTASVDSEKDRKDVSDMLSQSDIQKLEQLLASGEKSAYVDIDTLDDKYERTKIHQAVREGFPDLCSCTQANKVVIRCEMKKKGQQSRDQWPSKCPDFVKFVMYKENKDTMDAISLFARILRKRPGSFYYAGTKDRRAKTTQEVTAYRLSIEKLHGLNKVLRNIAVGNFRYVDETLRLGQLKGNRFVIVLREVTGNDDEIKKGLDSLNDIGFINYYGMQRFGTTAIPTYHIGRALLHSDWKEAVELILKPRQGEPDEVRECRVCLENTKDIETAINKMPKAYSIERVILYGMKEFGMNDYFNIFYKIPRNTRLMYVHSYQSYIWNRIVSKRIREYGLVVVDGDLVIPGDKQSEITSHEDDNISEEEVMDISPTIVTPANISKYTIEDVVLPLPGYRVSYPVNKIAKWYEEMLDEDDLTINGLKTKQKDYSLPGTYRHIVVRPLDVVWDTCLYDDYTQPLTLSDLDRLNGLTVPPSKQEGKYKALKLEMTLTTSSYATMAIREVLKTDTSPAHQSTLNPSGQAKYSSQ